MRDILYKKIERHVNEDAVIIDAADEYSKVFNSLLGKNDFTSICPEVLDGVRVKQTAEQAIELPTEDKEGALAVGFSNRSK